MLLIEKSKTKRILTTWYKMQHKLSTCQKSVSSCTNFACQIIWQFSQLLHGSTCVNMGQLTTVLPNSQPLLEFGHSQETPVSWNKHVKLQRHEVENRWERLTFNFVATLNYLEPLQKQAWQSSLVESQDLSWWTSFSCNLSCNLLHVRCLYLSKFGNKDRIGTYWSF